MRLTNDEKAILLGLLEDMSDDEDIEQQPMDIKETIVSVIRKLGGAYFGKLTNEQVPDKVDLKKELVDDFEKHLHGNKDGILYHHYCIKCGWDWWTDEAFPNRCSKCGCELI